MFHSHSHTYAHNYTQSAMSHWTYHSHTIGRTILSAQTLTHSLRYAHTPTAPSAWCIFGLRLEKLWDCHLCTRTHAHCTFDIEHWRWCLCNSSSGGGGVCVRECANVFLPTYFPFVCFFPFGKKAFGEHLGVWKSIWKRLVKRKRNETTSLVPLYNSGDDGKRQMARIICCHMPFTSQSHTTT